MTKKNIAPFIIILLCSLLFVSLHATSQSAITQQSNSKILFVGNSLTYSNDLPALFVKAAAEKGIVAETQLLAFPNYALEDHWNDGQLEDLISSGQFDFVVVQQGPSSQPDGRAMLLDYGARIKAICTAHHTKLAFFMVWPSKANFQSFDAVIKNYRDAAIATQSLLCPVGEKWKTYISSTDDYSYYGPDQFHPSLKGSEAAAKIIAATLFP